MGGFWITLGLLSTIITAWETEAITNKRRPQQQGGTVRDFRHIAGPSSANVHTDWEVGLREATNQALLREGYQEPNLRDRIFEAPLIGRQDTATPFGDIAVLARGQLYGAHSGSYAFVQDPYQNDCDDCHSVKSRCIRSQCESWKSHQTERLVALWTVKRLRHRDYNNIHRYELEYTVSPIGAAINEGFVTRNGHFDYAIPGHVFVVKNGEGQPKEPHPTMVYNRKIPHRHFKPEVLIGVSPDGRKHVLHSYPGFYTSFPVHPTYHQQGYSTNDPKEIELYKALIESLAAKTSTTQKVENGPHRFSLNQYGGIQEPNKILTTKPSYDSFISPQTPLVQLSTGQLVPLTEITLPVTNTPAYNQGKFPMTIQPEKITKPIVLSMIPTKPTDLSTQEMYSQTESAFPPTKPEVTQPIKTTIHYFTPVEEHLLTTDEMKKIKTEFQTMSTAKATTAGHHKPTSAPQEKDEADFLFPVVEKSTITSKTTKMYDTPTSTTPTGLDFLFPVEQATATSKVNKNYHSIITDAESQLSSSTRKMTTTRPTTIKMAESTTSKVTTTQTTSTKQTETVNITTKTPTIITSKATTSKITRPKPTVGRITRPKPTTTKVRPKSTINYSTTAKTTTPRSTTITTPKFISTRISTTDTTTPTTTTQRSRKTTTFRLTTTENNTPTSTSTKKIYTILPTTITTPKPTTTKTTTAEITTSVPTTAKTTTQTRTVTYTTKLLQQTTLRQETANSDYSLLPEVAPTKPMKGMTLEPLQPRPESDNQLQSPVKDTDTTMPASTRIPATQPTQESTRNEVKTTRTEETSPSMSIAATTLPSTEETSPSTSTVATTLPSTEETTPMTTFKVNQSHTESSEDIRKTTEQFTTQQTDLSTTSSITMSLLPIVKFSTTTRQYTETGQSAETVDLTETTPLKHTITMTEASDNRYTPSTSETIHYTKPTTTKTRITSTSAIANDFLSGNGKSPGYTNPMKADFDEDDIFGSVETKPKPTKAYVQKITESELAGELFGNRRQSGRRFKTDTTAARGTEIIYANFFEASTTPLSQTVGDHTVVMPTELHKTTLDLRPSTSQSYATSISFEVNKKNKTNSVDKVEYEPAVMATISEVMKDDDGYTVYKAELPTDTTSIVMAEDTGHDTKKAFDDVALQLVNHAKGINTINEIQKADEGYTVDKTELPMQTASTTAVTGSDAKKVFDDAALQLVNHARSIDYLSTSNKTRTSNSKYKRRRNYVPKSRRRNVKKKN